MRERIARAIAECRNARRVKDGGEDIGVLPSDFADAEAVLAAMREPTPEMLNVAIAAADRVNGEAIKIGPSPGDFVECYRAMLAAAAK